MNLCLNTILFLFLFLFLFLLLTILVSCYFYKRQKQRSPSERTKLPPGSMGWPYIGETLQLYSTDPNTFFSDKQKRYGDIFKTQILGCPCVMLGSPDAARFVLVSEAELFKPTYPKSKEELIGAGALFFHGGGFHSQVRKLVQSSLAPERIKKLIPAIQAIVNSSLHSWENGHVINTFHQIKKLSFEVGILAIFGHLEEEIKEEIREKYAIVDKGYNSFPTKLPGTAYYKALMARKKLSKILEDIIFRRKEKKMVENDLLGHFLNLNLSDDQISDNIIGILFAAQDTTASALTWILKYLHDDPKLMQAVTAEQRQIYLSNNNGNTNLTWAQTRAMTLTHKVILETLRKSSIVSFTYREAVEDVQYNGYLIPKGWKVMPLFRNIHHNPDFFTEPQKFDPYRFEVAPKPNTFMPFGSGAHSCPGNELAKLEMLIFIHLLVNKLRWEVVGPQNMVQYSPFPVPYGGLAARFWKHPDD